MLTRLKVQNFRSIRELVDADGETGRKRELEAIVHSIPGAKIIAVAIHEFETWLISDGAALASVLSAALSSSPHHPEELEPGEAKGLVEATDLDGC